MRSTAFVRRAWPKRQPPREKKTSKAYRPPEGFPKRVQDEIIVPRSGGICELDGCGRAVWFHHRRPRGCGGTSLEWVNRAANCLHVSDACHQLVEGRTHGSSRKWSLALGWLISQNSDVIAADIKVFYRGRWVLLADDGSVSPAPIEEAAS